MKAPNELFFVTRENYPQILIFISYSLPQETEMEPDVELYPASEELLVLKQLLALVPEETFTETF
jgi:hypothetical protein